MTVKKLQKKAKLRNAEYFGLQEVLDRLYAQSAENKRFTVLMELVSADENILLAYRNISKNKGSKTAGTDRKTVRYLSKFTNTALIHYIKRRLEQYQPQPVRRVEIPKGDTGKTRPLGIPTIADRLIQQCFLQILEPICEAKFHERSNGFRPNRSAEHALAQCYAMIQKRGLHYVVDIDIKGFFDNVSHGGMPTMTVKKLQKKAKLRNAEYFGLQEVLDRLYAQSAENKRFTVLMELVSADENILLAYRNISKNKGSKTAGTDRKTVRYLSKFTNTALIHYIKRRLEQYQPQPVRRVEIPKGDTGKTRPLGIPTIADRLIQQCFLQILEPICEAKFHERSNGFRPNRSAEHALAQCYAMIQKRGLHYVVDIDIKGFFDNVSHGKLLKQMWNMGIQDKRVLSIISAMLKAEVAGIGFPQKGTPQGGIISPLLSNIVLNELDWWIASQWENMPTRKNREYARSDNGVIDKSQKYEMLRKGSSLKECYIVRYADDFKIFCRKRSDAVKLFAATRDWLKERLGLDISPEKSRIVNLKRQYSDFLGFKLRAVRKGVKSNGTAKYAVESHMNDKAVKKVKRQTREMVKRIQSPANVNEEYKAIGAYNAYVSGIHNYYRYATHISKDIHKIALGITRTMQNRLRERLQKQGNPLPAYIAERYGRSKQIRYVSGQAVIPIGYVQTKAPLYKRREVNQYTEQGRRSIHKNLESVNMSILHYLMRNPVQFASVELNNNRLALYCAQHGCCAVTKQPLEIGDIHCHHKLPREKGGNDQYGNLVLVTETVHILIHATDSEVIARLVQTLRLNTRQRAKLNTLRKIAGLFSI